jgi:hypothetical protein
MICKGGYKTLSIAAVSLLDLRCAPHPQPSPEPECRIAYVESCEGSNGYVVVSAEYEMDQTGYGTLTRIVSVTPDSPAVRDDVLKKVPKGVRPSSASPPGPLIKTFQFCERPSVMILAHGPCPSEDELVKQAIAGGYTVRGVKRSDQ